MGAVNNTFTQGYHTSYSKKKKRVKQMRRENGWNSYIKPISKFNESVHTGQKIGFDKI
jgi:hypothetical protein